MEKFEGFCAHDEVRELGGLRSGCWTAPAGRGRLTAIPPHGGCGGDTLWPSPHSYPPAVDTIRKTLKKTHFWDFLWPAVAFCKKPSVSDTSRPCADTGPLLDEFGSSGDHFWFFRAVELER